MSAFRIGIVGVGAIGGFIASELCAAPTRARGVEVVLIGQRPRAEELRAVRIDGRALAPARPPPLTGDYGTLERVDVCLVTVKSKSTDAVARALAASLSPATPVVSLQNGLDNPEVLRARLGDRVAAGVVGYNVQVDADGVRRQATRSKLFIERRSGQHGARLERLRDALIGAGDQVELSGDIGAVVHGKLLLNLNNGICAATGLGIAASLRDRDARWAYAQCMQEGAQVLRRAGRRAGSVTLVPPHWMARALALPDWMILPIARGIAGVSEHARSSTLQDLDRGVETEIEDLNGAIVRLAAESGASAPANRVVTELVHEHERSSARGEPPAYVSALGLRARITDAVRA